MNLYDKGPEWEENEPLFFFFVSKKEKKKSIFTPYQLSSFGFKWLDETNLNTTQTGEVTLWC